MAYQKYKQGDSSWIVDTVEDLKYLPQCSMGSSCYVISNASRWMINSKGQWICQSAVEAPEGSDKPDTPIVEPGISAEEVAANYLSKQEYKLDKLKSVDYEATGLPEGTLVDYRDKEIRIFIPEDATLPDQQPGENGNPNMWYFQFKAYAPEDAVYFKEDDLEEIEDETLYDFVDNDFAGVDEYGRKYSIIWLAAAYKENNEWVLFSTKSSEAHMIGFFYSVEWYDANQKLIGLDKIRINLTNKECHAMIEPYYMYDLKTTWGELEN